MVVMVLIHLYLPIRVIRQLPNSLPVTMMSLHLLLVLTEALQQQVRCQLLVLRLLS